MYIICIYVYNIYAYNYVYMYIYTYTYTEILSCWEPCGEAKEGVKEAPEKKSAGLSHVTINLAKLIKRSHAYQAKLIKPSLSSVRVLPIVLLSSDSSTLMNIWRLGVGMSCAVPIWTALTTVVPILNMRGPYVRVVPTYAWSYWTALTVYTRSPLEDSRLFGPSPWKIFAATYEQKDYWATQPLAKIF